MSLLGVSESFRVFPSGLRLPIVFTFLAASTEPQLIIDVLGNRLGHLVLQSAQFLSSFVSLVLLKLLVVKLLDLTHK